MQPKPPILNQTCSYAPPVCASVHPGFKCPQQCGGKVTIYRRNYYRRAGKSGDRHQRMCEVHAAWHKGPI